MQGAKRGRGGSEGLHLRESHDPRAPLGKTEKRAGAAVSRRTERMRVAQAERAQYVPRNYSSRSAESRRRTENPDVSEARKSLSLVCPSLHFLNSAFRWPKVNFDEG